MFHQDRYNRHRMMAFQRRGHVSAVSLLLALAAAVDVEIVDELPGDLQPREQVPPLRLLDRPPSEPLTHGPVRKGRRGKAKRW